jgi:hypothetical protein
LGSILFAQSFLFFSVFCNTLDTQSQAQEGYSLFI